MSSVDKVRLFLVNKKSVLTPTQSLKYLGLFVDSQELCFRLPVDKKLAFQQLREHLLSCTVVDLHTLQRFVGKCISFMLVVPGAKIYIREVNAAISRHCLTGEDIIMTGKLFDEVAHWRFLDTWAGVMPWRDDKHLQVVLASDASLYKWGAVIYWGSDRQEVSTGDYWQHNDARPIHLKEADALICALKCASSHIINSRVDAYVDSMDVVCAWNGQGCKSLELNDCIKRF